LLFFSVRPSVKASSRRVRQLQEGVIPRHPR
jgi:hypothetical protein